MASPGKPLGAVPEEGHAVAHARCFTAWVALGGNLSAAPGGVPATFRLALARLAALPDTRLIGVSALFESAPWEASGPQFFNAVAALDTALGAAELLRTLLAIEAEQGRARPHVNAPRTLDLDLLSHGNRYSDTAFLTLPHPRALERAFVLGPWAELRGRLPADPLAPALPGAEAIALLCAAQGAQQVSDASWAAQAKPENSA
jgi:2-amino-4-hydroxy-6-hydroxymethyldihydropteridine diphosphokinase